MPASALVHDVDLYASAFADFEGRARGEAPWILALRREAFAHFQEVGFPSTHDEAWKYTNAAPIARTPWESPAPEAARRALPLAMDLSATARLVFVNGRFSSALSSERSALPEGVDLHDIATVLREHPDWLQPHLSRQTPHSAGAFGAWNTAFFEDGVFLRVRRGARIPEPIHLYFVSDAPGPPTVSHPRNLILAESGSESAIVETYAGDGTSLTNAVTEIVVADGAVLEHYKVQRESTDAFHVHTIAASQGRTSRLTSHNIALGAALARTDIRALLDGEGAECVLNGLFVGGGSQHLDNHTTIDHAKPHGSSRELYKGILDGRSRGVFHGTILVRKDAQKTDAIQTNRNLLLSREALVNSTPALEINADDVKCKHGSTIGQIDAHALFYLRSRGIGEDDARALLTWAFAEDVARRIRIPSIRAGVEAALGLRLPGSETAGDRP